MVKKVDDDNAKSIQLCLTCCDSMDCSPPGSFVHGILQARIREWVAISFSKKEHGGDTLFYCHKISLCFSSSMPGGWESQSLL